MAEEVKEVKAPAKKDAKARLRERKARLTELQQKRLREVSKRYKESKGEV